MTTSRRKMDDSCRVMWPRRGHLLCGRHDSMAVSPESDLLGWAGLDCQVNDVAQYVLLSPETPVDQLSSENFMSVWDHFSWHTLVEETQQLMQAVCEGQTTQPALQPLKLSRWEGHALLLSPVGYMRPTWQACEHALQGLKAEAIAEAHKLDQALISALGVCVVQTMLHMRQNQNKHNCKLVRHFCVGQLSGFK